MTTWLRLGSVTELAAQAPDAQSWMSEGELARLAAKQSARRRDQFVAGRWLARGLLAEAFGGARRDWILTGGAESPPVVSGGGVPAKLSISHSGDLVACAVGGAALGLDLEPCRSRKGLEALYGAITTDLERATLADHSATPDPVQQFAHAWTLKEAGLKCHGGGLFATMLGHGLTIEAASGAQDANACTWLHDNHVIALCSDELRAMIASGMPVPRFWRLVPSGTATLQ
ncbi:4'-phosphopantetheinyl transferase superfamily protein [Cupriavidus sp. amp6]|uniref:4'-phosphopantetheinyl transferase family protein n=1 Tax=Cupriavidus sp. amp6 TaxID=388051 RepID=UPI0003FCB353|nr:4'-phosphopantetheinyl transferase superfamily protein [Cupriavidus sp. amp6]